MTNQPNYAQMALAVYQACANHDPYLTTMTADMARAWGRHFEIHRLVVEDLLAAVTLVYIERGEAGFRPGPKDIADAARKIRQDRNQRETREQRQAREDRLDTRLGQDRALPGSPPSDRDDSVPAAYRVHDAIDRPCPNPRCGAAAGEPCVTGEGTVRRIPCVLRAKPLDAEVVSL